MKLCPLPCVSKWPDQCYCCLGGRLGTLLLVLPKHPPKQGLVVADEGGDGVVGVAGARPRADQLIQPLGAGKVLEMISQ